ncbi:MAG: methylenetetrahydrofolate reductase C-terminal domain-containing protein [Acidimicrobiia bacterium]
MHEPHSLGHGAGSNVEACPKSMHHGPCGGVHQDGGCEVDDRTCPFLREARMMPTPRRPSVPLELAPPVVLVDVRVPLAWTGDTSEFWSRTAASLSGCWVLIGEHVDNRSHTDDAGVADPSAVVETFAEAGVPAIVTVTGRDRDLAEARSEIRRLRDAGATAIHCVTGDHPAAVGLDRPAKFGAESMTLSSVVAEEAMPATVAESPASPGHRVERLVAKAAAGASACILNHSGAAETLIAFGDECLAAGLTLPLIAPLPMVGDARAAAALAALPGLRLPAGMLASIGAATDPFAEGLAWATELGAQLAASGRFVGCNLSGAAAGTDPWSRLAATVQFADAIRTTWESASPTPR